MKKTYLFTIGYILLAILAGVLLYYKCNTTFQASKACVVEAEFAGEYSIGGSKWRPFDKNTRISAFEGDLVLRGFFCLPILRR